ncbi:FAD-dependent oxidoreductase [Faecalicatena acetigenes]|uniref:FAD-dependent oxidoreductase n=1 Tax=Faecalicatena acetigenes TaxID=2981790 RepID=A0ABT2TES2_9FIRM|nr:MULTISPECIES: FAD-dependent oxidoreductase [Lachnospiraceae]MCU6748491.1 FAD-dependent oxidoreductase [Faecalicatena acetigenes]SCI47388.1 NADH oxidase [uncultured Clostridium sp.]
MNNNYSHLLSRGQIGKLKLKNRMVMAPMGTFSENRDGYPSKAQIEYYAERAKGGLGMIITEVQYVTNKTDPWIDYIMTAGTDEQMKGWALLTEAIHAHDCKVCIQLGCGLGRNAFPFSSDQMVSASAVPSFYFPDQLCRPFTIEEIKDIIEKFRLAGRHAVIAEADAIEIHAHSGYILDQFMTPAWNKRTDEYGGSFENRMRLVREIYEVLREEVGPDFPILLRMGAYHDFEGGRTLEESIEIAKYLEDLGIDALDVDLGCYERKQWIVPSIYAGDSCMAEAASRIKEAVHIPVLNAGNHTPETAEQLIKEGKIDFAMFGRQVVADPYMPEKLRWNEREDVRPCILCNEVCVRRLYENRVISCAVNPQAVFEANYPLTPAAHTRKVAVIGGGPGGMEAARVAAVRGHEVTLYEKSGELGGQLLAAYTPPFKSRLREFVKWQKLQLEKVGVQVCLHTEITEESEELKEADQIIVAVGATAICPPIPGIDAENVVDVLDAHTQPERIKGETILVAGGGLSGCDYALEMAMQGRKVMIVEMKEEIAQDALLDNRNPLLFKLEDYGVKMYTNCKITQITPEGIHAVYNGEETEIKADTIVTAFGMKSRLELADKIADKYPNTSIVGDCGKIGQVAQAVRGGFFAGWAVR